MTRDKNKGITGITYNHLNLPTQISFGSNKIAYIYDALGTKLKKEVTQGSSVTRTEYAGNYIYENGELQFFSHPEGYVTKENNAYKYVYQYKDHLGNVRVTYADLNNNGIIDPATETLSENNYYPGGLLYRGYNNIVSPSTNSTAEKFKYQGKELEEELGKDTYAFGWRDYDPATLRMRKIDRFAEKYYDQSPYHFSKNNPIYYQEIAGDSVRVTQVSIYDNANGTDYQQQLIDDWQQQTGLTLSVDANTGVIGYATDADGNAIISTTTDADGNVIENGSASARADLMGYIDGTGVTDIGITPNNSATPHGGNQIWLGESQINSFINGTPAELNNGTLGFGMTALHEFRHTAAGGSNSDPTTAGDVTSTGPVVNRVNTYRSELDNNPANTNSLPYGQRRHYQAVPSGNSSTVRFRYQAVNRRGRTVNRNTIIRF